MPIARKLPLLNIKNARNKQVQSALLKSASSAVLPCDGRWRDSTTSTTSGSLSPNLQPPTPPTFNPASQTEHPACPSKLGKYILLEQIDRDTWSCIDVHSQLKYVCKSVRSERYYETFSAHYRLDSCEHINQIQEIMLFDNKTYMIYNTNFGDLHSYVRERRRLKEADAISLFKQIVKAVAACHEAGIVLRDLKLRRFVFKDPQKTSLMLETLDDAFLFDEENDSLADKHGCPAYVSPEILTTSGSYSGKAADVWSLGVMLYTMLLGRYPFHDTDPKVLFSKICRGAYVVPDSVSSKAKCLIRALLRMDPSERLTAEDALEHPWFSSESRYSDNLGNHSYSRSRCLIDRLSSEKVHRVSDQTVPELDSFSLSTNKSSEDISKSALDTSSVMASSNNDCPFMFP